MPRLDPATWNNVIGRLQPGVSQVDVARTVNVSRSTISSLLVRYHQTGCYNARSRSGRPRITTPGKNRYISYNLFVVATATAVGIPGMWRINTQTETDFENIVLVPGDRILDLFWGRYTYEKESDGATDWGLGVKKSGSAIWSDVCVRNVMEKLMNERFNSTWVQAQLTSSVEEVSWYGRLYLVTVKQNWYMFWVI